MAIVLPGVTRVRVLVLDEAWKTLESGDAIRAEGDWWEYATRVEGKRTLAKAFNLPGNGTKLDH